MAEVQIRNVGKSYGEHSVLGDFSLQIRDGECFTLLGPSGCGKTVLLRLIAGFEKPDTGSISIGEKIVSSPAKGIYYPPEQRRIGVVFQDYAVWPHKTVQENVIYPLTIQKIPKAEAAARTRGAIAAVNLTDLENRYPYQLSGGQQQRVALARALVAEPDIMLLDEPLCNLDANLREEMRFEIKQMQVNTGVTILYVTHDQEVALAISDRIAIMDQKGCMRQIGVPESVFETPVDSYVFQFMGVSNFLPAERGNGEICVKDTSYVIDWKSNGGPQPPEGGSFFAAFRPSDAELTRDSAGLGGIVKRRNFLGHIIDYRIQVAEHEIRVQQDAHSALAGGAMFDEGEQCGIRFLRLLFYDSADNQETSGK
ncbi:MAG: ABC transporter ATP-binding protein [Syntrophobacteraceae bacterium]